MQGSVEQASSTVSLALPRPLKASKDPTQTLVISAIPGAERAERTGALKDAKMLNEVPLTDCLSAAVIDSVRVGSGTSVGRQPS